MKQLYTVAFALLIDLAKDRNLVQQFAPVLAKLYVAIANAAILVPTLRKEIESRGGRL